MSCKYNNSMYTIVEPSTIETSFYTDSEEGTIEDYITYEENLQCDFDSALAMVDADNERIEAEYSSLIKNIDNYVTVPQSWVDSEEQIARDLYALDKKGMMSLIRFISYLNKYEVMSKEDIETAIHGFLNLVESHEIINEFERRFHESFGVIE